MNWFKQLPSWVKGTIALLTSIIGLVVLFLNNVNLSVVVSFAVFLVAAFCISIYGAFSRKQSEVITGRYIYRFPQYRAVALVGIAFLTFVTISLLAIGSTRSYIINAFVGTPTPTLTPAFSIADVIVAEAEDHYQVEIIISNPFKQDILAKHIRLQNILYRPDIQCCQGCGVGAFYVLSDRVVIRDVNNKQMQFKGSITSKGDELSNYQYAVIGIVEMTQCNLYWLTLDFDTAFVLKAGTYTAFYVQLPKEFIPIEGKTELMQNGSPELSSIVVSTQTIDFPPPTELIEVRIRLETDMGVQDFRKEIER